jgi:hypothetical protein
MNPFYSPFRAFPYRFPVNIDAAGGIIIGFLSFRYLYQPCIQTFTQFYRLKSVDYLAKRRFIRYPVGQYHKSLEKILLKPPKRFHLLKLIAAPENRREANHDDIYQFMPDVPLRCPPRFHYFPRTRAHFSDVFFPNLHDASTITLRYRVSFIEFVTKVNATTLEYCQDVVTYLKKRRKNCHNFYKKPKIVAYIPKLKHWAGRRPFVKTRKRQEGLNQVQRPNGH